MIPKQPKYRAKKCAFEGRIYDSQAEMKRAMILKIWLAEGHISDLEYQPRFTLQEAFRDNCGRLNRKIEYVPDFYYFEVATFQSVAEDVKGMQTPDYRLKAKLFRAKFPDLVHREIKNGRDMLTHKPKKRKGK